MRRISAAFGADLWRAGLGQSGDQTLAILGLWDQVDAEAGANRGALDSIDRDLFMAVLGQGRGAGELGAARPDQRDDRPLGA